MKPLNSILQWETTFPSEITLHFTVSGIISDIKTMKQELGRLSSTPQQIRGLVLFASFIKNHGVLWVNTGKAHLFVTCFCLQGLILTINTSKISPLGSVVHLPIGTHRCYCVNNFV